MIGKFEKLLDCIKANNYRAFALELGEKSKNDDDRNFFGSLKMNFEMMKEQFIQKALEDENTKVREFCKKLISHDLITSEIIRLCTVCAMNLKFSDL
jgi:hypothetical protein